MEDLFQRSETAYVFADGGGVSFGTAGQTVTATVRTNYQSSGAYLTTAMQSNRGSDFVQATAVFHGTNLSGTIASDGISVSAGNYITTAMQSNRGSDFVAASATLAGTSISGTFGSNGVSLSVGPYLTTAMQSNRGSDFVQATATIAGTSISGTIASGGISLSVGPYITTADLSQNSSKYAGINGAITGGSITVNTSGVSVNLPAYLTTAMVSNRGSDFVQAAAGFNGTNASGTIASGAISVSVAAQSNQTAGIYASSNTYLTSSGTVDARSLSFRGDKSITVGISSGEVVFSVGAYITTADLSQNSSKYAGINGAITGGSITVNTSGVSVNVAAQSAQTVGLYASSNTYLTSSGTQDARSLSFRGDKSITVGISSGEVMFSVGAYITTARASTDAVGLNTALTANGVAWTVNSSGISLNVPAFLTTAMSSNRGTDFVQAAAALAGTNASGTIASGGISVSVKADGVMSMWPDVLPASTAVATYYSGSTSQGAGGGSTQTGYTFSLYGVPIPLQAPVAFSELRLGISLNTAAGTGSVTHLWSGGFYTNNASTLSIVKAFYGGLLLSQNSQTSQTFSVVTMTTGGNTVGGNGGFAGLAVSTIFSRAVANMSSDSQVYGRLQFINLGSGAVTTLTDAQYYFILAQCSVSSGANVLSNVGFVQSNAITSAAIPDIGRENATQTSNYLPAWGAISTTFTSVSNAATWFPLPNAIAISNMTLSQASCQRFHFPVMRNHS